MSKSILDYLHAEFLNLLINADNNIAEQFMNLYDDNVAEQIPKKLYKYKFDSEPYMLNSILENKLYLNSPKNFNDPLDCQYLQWMIAKIENDIHALTKGEKIAALEPLNQLMVSCLSEVEPNHPLSTLLWAHYAKFHQGICIEYNTIDIIKSLKHASSIVKNDTPMICMLPVQYCTPELLKEINKDVPNSILDIFYKQPPWEYEHEWRILHASQSKYIIVKPAKIWFGCRNNIQSLYQYLCEKNNIPTGYIDGQSFICTAN